jgi:two-component system sensor histidine kinase RegB
VASQNDQFHVNKELLELGLVTLLDNASQSQQRAGVQAPLQLGLECSGSSVMLMVSDAGQGIEPELLPKIGRQPMDANGQGMGLFLLSNLVEREGGQLTLRNLQPGVCATISLPVRFQ